MRASAWNAVAAAVAVATAVAGGCDDRGGASRSDGRAVHGEASQAASAARDAARSAASALGHAGRAVAGTVQDASNELLRLGDGGGVPIGRQTRFYRDGEPIDRREVRPGDEVRAAYDADAGDGAATRVDVTRAGAGR